MSSIVAETSGKPEGKLYRVEPSKAWIKNYFHYIKTTVASQMLEYGQ